MENTKQIEATNTKSREVDLRWFIVGFFSYWHWFLLSVIFFLFGGYIYLRYSVPVYEVSSKIAVKDSRKGGLSNTELSFYEGLGFLQANSIVENEMKVLGSRNLIKSVVLENELFIEYIVKGRFKDTELYGNSNPFYSSTPIRVFADETVISSLQGTVILQVTVGDNSMIRVEGKYGSATFAEEYSSLPGILVTPVGELLLLPGETTVLRKQYPLEVRIIPPLAIAQKYVGLLNLDLPDKNTTIATLSLRETHRERGRDFLKTLVDLYNRDTMDDKNKAARIASDFIQGRLEVLSKDLHEAEKNVETYKRDNYIASLPSESVLAVDEDNALGKKIVQLETQKVMLSYLLEELNKNNMQIIPPLERIGDASLNMLLQKYNAYVTERERLLNLVTSDAPIIKRQDEQIASMRTSIRRSISGVMYALDKETDESVNFSSKYTADIQDIPRRERELEDLERTKNIKAELYVALLTQREEIELTLAITAPSATVLEDPLPSGSPVAPNRFIIYMLCLVCGILFPFVIIALRDILNFKLSSENEINRFSEVPVIISFPYIKKIKEGILISPSATTPIVERFRLLRTNLQFIFGTEKKSILLTSTVSGEGKTFISMNLAATFALKYRTLLVGLDVRRPKMNTYLGLPNKKGIISYILGEESDVDKLITKNVNGSNLDILVSGPVPPNPNELLIDKQLDELFVILRQKYEYIIIDSSPIGSVSDAFLLNRISDVSLYVMRGGLTPKSAIPLVNNIYKEKRLNNLNLVLNGFNTGKHHNYGYGYDYGYGYGYGYGYSNYGYGYGYGYESKIN
ncbi:MAG: polysaccharide biosynthesis tyrosine autokinase [Dysgonamonadaceae bacterium]|jgi:capsular exopolysaccharide synthesis family protein|nr:polysaccharide biosynthesis tyrosine autokinase [Dysgonamonadaceae bacterium]